MMLTYGAESLMVVPNAQKKANSEGQTPLSCHVFQRIRRPMQFPVSLTAEMKQGGALWGRPKAGTSHYP